jgi:hypothetical protein
MIIRFLFLMIFLAGGNFLYAQTHAPTSATDADVKIHKGRKYRRIQGDGHATERQGQSVPKQKVYRPPGSSRELMQKQNKSAKKPKSSRAKPKKRKG